MAKSEIREETEPGNTQACRVFLTGAHYRASIFDRLLITEVEVTWRDLLFEY